MALATDSAIVYPESDGQPMADNTLQFRWIVLIKENLECLFAADPQVFVGGDLLWYPVEGRPEIRVVPDVMVALGRPKGERGSYRQWQEEQIPPQVVFEVLSPGNTLKEMAKKLKFYERYGVEEYYIYDPAAQDLAGFQRLDGELAVIEAMEDWVSPRLGIRFGWVEDRLQLCYPEGRPFLTMVELAQQRDQAQQQADQAQQRAERLAAKLRELGINPEEI